MSQTKPTFTISPSGDVVLISYEPSSLFPGGFERRETIVANQGARCQGPYMVDVLNLVFEIGQRYAKTGCVYPTFREQEEPYVLPAILVSIGKAAEVPVQTEPQVNLNPDFRDLEKAQTDVLSAFVRTGRSFMTAAEIGRGLEHTSPRYSHVGVNSLLDKMSDLGYVRHAQGGVWKITNEGLLYIRGRGVALQPSPLKVAGPNKEETNVLKAFAEMKLSATTIDAIFNMLVIAGADTSLLLVKRLFDQLEEKQFVVRDGTAVWKLTSKGMEFVEGLQKPSKPETQQATAEVPAKDEGLTRILKALSHPEPSCLTIVAGILQKLAAPETPQQEEEPLCASHHISVLVPFLRLGKAALTALQISECLIKEEVFIAFDDVELLLRNAMDIGWVVHHDMAKWQITPKGLQTLEEQGVLHETRVLKLLAANPYGLAETHLNNWVKMNRFFGTQTSKERMTEVLREDMTEFMLLRSALLRLVEQKKVVRLDKGAGHQPLYWLATNPPGQ